MVGHRAILSISLQFQEQSTVLRYIGEQLNVQSQFRSTSNEPRLFNENKDSTQQN